MFMKNVHFSIEKVDKDAVILEPIISSGCHADATSQVFNGSKAQHKTAVGEGGTYTNDYSITQE